MAERDNPVERLALAAVGAVALTAERADALADELVERGGMTRDEARSLVEDLLTRWRGDAVRLGERAGDGLQGVFEKVGLVTRAEFKAAFPDARSPGGRSASLCTVLIWVKARILEDGDICRRRPVRGVALARSLRAHAVDPRG